MVSNTNEETLKATLKFRNHPKIFSIQNKCKDKDTFNLTALKLARNYLSNKKQQKKNKIHRIVVCWKLCVGFRKDQFYNLYYSILF